jgi:hypothetical protein
VNVKKIYNGIVGIGVLITAVPWIMLPSITNVKFLDGIGKGIDGIGTLLSNINPRN